MSENEALVEEEFLIKRIGRIDLNTGTLTNLTDGNDGVSNCIITKTRKVVYKIDMKTLDVIDSYDSITKASTENGISISSISSCCRGAKGVVTSGGYIWSFTNVPIRDNVCKRVIDLIDKNNVIIKTYNSIKEASDSLNITSPLISRCCMGELLSTNGYIFQYNNINLREKYKDKRNREKTKSKKKILQIIGTVIIIHDSVTSASIYNNISCAYVSKICRGMYICVSKFNLMFYDYNDCMKYKSDVDYINNKEHGNSIPIIQYDLDNNIIAEWKSATIASMKLSINGSCITSCCKNRRNTSGGFKWSYKI